MGRILSRLNDAAFDYVVVGGIAVIAYGYVRVTEDLDVMVPDTPETGSALRELLQDWGATAVSGDRLPDAVFDGVHHVRALTPDGVVDFIPEGAAPLDFDSVRAGSVEAQLDGQPAPIIGLAHLVAMKRLAGRPRDRADLFELEEAQGPLPETDPPVR
ncbi:MAG TPA: hypothetical protein VNT32_08845 [Thermoleophilaceae bacterium]|nr:hypothetical protein [Thermoleophilaceae bacterium]